jgi:hypothetical protein
MTLFRSTIALGVLLIGAVACVGAGVESGRQSASTAKPAPVTNLTVQVEGKVVTVRNNGHNEHIPRIDLTSVLAPFEIVIRCDLYFARQDAAGAVWVFDVEGSSRDSQGQGHCGSGIEGQLVYVRQDSHGRIVAMESVIYESCWSDYYTVNGVERTVSGLRVCYDAFLDGVHCVAAFDFDSPEKGLVRVTSPLKVPAAGSFNKAGGSSSLGHRDTVAFLNLFGLSCRCPYFLLEDSDGPSSLGSSMNASRKATRPRPRDVRGPRNPRERIFSATISK